MKRHLTAGLALAMALSGCNTYPQDRNPEVSNMRMDPLSMPEAASVSVPMPEPTPYRMPQRAEAASLWQMGSNGFFADQRASEVGDILTINIEIDDQANISNATERQRDGGSSIGFPTLMGYEQRIDDLLPFIDKADLPTGNLVDLNSMHKAGGSGSIDRAETINLQVAALVVKRLPNGNLVIAGRQEVMVNNELRELRIAGIIRPQDIQRDNSISHEKIAEARITYGGRGQISRQTRNSYGEDAMNIIMPY